MAGEAGKAFHRVRLSPASLSPGWQHTTRARNCWDTHTGLQSFRSQGSEGLEGRGPPCSRHPSGPPGQSESQ